VTADADEKPKSAAYLAMKAQFDAADERGKKILIARALVAKKNHVERAKHAAPGGLLHFVRYFWNILEPMTPLVEGWPLAALCDHLEAVSRGQITRLLINVPPGFMKSLLSNVFLPAWHWSAYDHPHSRFLAFSYAASLTERDNRKLLSLFTSDQFQQLYGNKFKLGKAGESLISNDKTGFKLASSVGGVGTGERADVLTCLPYSEKILTDRGWLPIGEVVENRLNVRVAGFNHLTNRLEWQSIIRYEKNPGQEILQFECKNSRTLKCTGEHPLFVFGRGYVKACEVGEGEQMVRTWGHISMPEMRSGDTSQAEPRSQILQQKMQARGGIRAISPDQQSSMRYVRHSDLSAASALEEAYEPRQVLLQSRMSRSQQCWGFESSLYGATRQSVPSLRATVSGDQGEADILFVSLLGGCVSSAHSGREVGHDTFLSSLRDAVRACDADTKILQPKVRRQGSCATDQRKRQRALRSWGSAEAISSGVDADSQRADSDARWAFLSPVSSDSRAASKAGRSPHRLQQGELGPEQSNYALPILSWQDARPSGFAGGVEEETVVSIKRLPAEPYVYNLEVGPHHNYIANGFLVHNCDDPHAVRDAESETVRNNTVTWFKETMQNRLNDPRKSAIIVIMQRVHQGDISGIIRDEYSNYEKLTIPMMYDGRDIVNGQKEKTSIGWYDPRTKDSEIAWPERYDMESLRPFMSQPYLWASQYQQTPEPRGGAIIKREYWKKWDRPNYPSGISYIIASADTAYTEKVSNDPSALTIWGLFDIETQPHLFLMYAWRKRLELHGLDTDRKPGESEPDWIARTQHRWGLCEWLGYSCKRFKVHKLIIEGKASGLSVAQELRRLYRGQGWSIETVTPEGDKVARAHAAVSTFTDGLVFAPDKIYSRLVIDETAMFPRGRYKDLTDTVTQGIKHFRDNGLLLRRTEKARYDDEERHTNHHPEPLYPV
jgi:predicted phage terminase large subunit-like protein